MVHRHVATSLTHTNGQQTLESQEKSLETAMKLEATPKDDTLGGVQQIQE